MAYYPSPYDGPSPYNGAYSPHYLDAVPYSPPMSNYGGYGGYSPGYIPASPVYGQGYSPYETGYPMSMQMPMYNDGYYVGAGDYYPRRRRHSYHVSSKRELEDHSHRYAVCRAAAIVDTHTLRLECMLNIELWEIE